VTAPFKADGFRPYVDPMSFRLVVTGGPRFGEPCRGKSFARADAEQAHVWAVLDDVARTHGFDTLVYAERHGAAACAYRWSGWGHLLDEFDRPDFARYGRRAYLRQNEAIVQAGACLLVAFPGGGRFVADLLERAARAGIPLRDERGWRPGAGRVVSGEGG
jgi:hypothetical protein